ncbi:DUF1289 domain-containing protein [Burkholderia contaminans]|uniref:DUF1289 domain-containing protein n=1 Tax=Burkholderia contaminans TaxID=488447 RepID=A0A3N8PX67_9BURK|nr:DUF1289 domain-containing protein [Burkholderia contaminans]RQT16168.1 DUF1289 domain-containing protein [Burkholderia contaminans]
MASTLHDLPDSPCVGVCSTLFDDVCQGCGRTADEVSHWVFMNDDEKRAIWERSARRCDSVATDGESSGAAFLMAGARLKNIYLS